MLGEGAQGDGPNGHREPPHRYQLRSGGRTSGRDRPGNGVRQGERRGSGGACNGPALAHAAAAACAPALDRGQARLTLSASDGELLASVGQPGAWVKAAPRLAGSQQRAGATALAARGCPASPLSEMTERVWEGTLPGWRPLYVPFCPQEAVRELTRL